MDFKQIKLVHIIGIGGCASSAIAEFLVKNKILVTGSEMKYREGLIYLENMGIPIAYRHHQSNLYLLKQKPDVVLYSPAVTALNPNNPEIIETTNLKIPLLSWQSFIGDYLNSIGKIGITVSGSEGKGTTAGILTAILKETKWDPLAILGAKLKNFFHNQDTNIYLGKGSAYILEADEYNYNFYNYHPAINLMINFQYDHPETYKNDNEYKEAFYNFFMGMNEDKTLILRASENIYNFISKYPLPNHQIIWFNDESDQQFDISFCDYIICDHIIDEKGNSFTIKNIKGKQQFKFFLSILPGYMVYNASSAIITALHLGLSPGQIQKNLNNFKGMIRRFDLYKTKNNGIIITDYGHSPNSITHIINEIRNVFKEKKIHLIFQPHLFSRTYNFLNDFINALKKADRISLIDIYPARENPDEWADKISSLIVYDQLKKINCCVEYLGKSSEIKESLLNKINETEITCFIGAGDMDLYYPYLFEKYEVKSYYQ